MPKAIANTKPNMVSRDAKYKDAPWLGGPGIIPGEDEEAYARLATSLRDTLKPTDAIELLLVDDVVAHAWESRRWRRLQSGMLLAGSHAGMKKALTALVGAAKADELADGWVQRDPAKVAEVEQLVASGRLSFDVVMAESTTTKVDLILRVDGLQAAHETRLAAALRELDRYREGAGKAAREMRGSIGEPILEADFEDVPRGTSGWQA